MVNQSEGVERKIFPPREDEQRIREAVVAEAKTWLRTPFRNHAKVKGHGVDCSMLLYEVYRRAGVDFGSLEPGFYSCQWFLHSSEEIYLNAIRAYAGEVPGPPERNPKPADAMLCRYMDIGNVFNHSAIVIDWPTVIHVLDGGTVQWANTDVDLPLKNVTKKLFSLWD
jgi:cell wall-associated NlpC family hydrolase